MRALLVAFVALFALLGCGANPIPVSLPDDQHTVEYHQLVIDAGDILGWEIDFDANSYGTLHLDLHNAAAGEPKIGRALLRWGCVRVAWASRNPAVVAHEMAHLLGLEHSPDPDNLMYSTVPSPDICVGTPGDWLEDWQLDAIQAANGHLRACG